MFNAIPAYTPPSNANIQPNFVNASADVRNITVSSDGINDRLAQLTNNIKRELTNADNGASLNQNQDTGIFCNATSGAFAITLPALSGQYKSILVKKHKDVSYNTVTINAAGSDTIQNINSPLAVFTATNFKLTSPDQYVVFTPTTAGWEITSIKDPVVNFQADLTTGSYSVTDTEAKLYYNNEVYDTGGYYNPATTGVGGRHTPLIAGMYDYNAAAYFASGTASELILQLRKNGSPITQLSSPNVTGNAVIETSKHVYMNGTTDYVEVWIRSAIATKTILNLSYVTWFQGKWSSFY